MFKEYRGLRKEIYILCFGKMVTNMGALIWPMLTLILSNKMGCSAGEIATIMLIMTIVSIPFTILGGKLADKVNKKNLIVICDSVTIISYFIMGLIPLGKFAIALFFIAGLFANMEGPAYDAITADLTSSEDRERAYSLNYLGANLGLVLAPTLGGILFENYLNVAFFINAFSTLSSTLLIFFFVKDISKVKSDNDYEDVHEGNLFEVLKDRKVLYLYFFITCIGSLVYSQFNYLMPLQLESIFQTKGAVFFGTITSVNCIVVLLCTPLFTNLTNRRHDVVKMILGEVFITLGYVIFVRSNTLIWLYYISITIFTFGEILNTLGSSPYYTKRIPSSHRGRIIAVSMVFCNVIQAIFQKGVGYVVDSFGYSIAWNVVIVCGIVNVVLLIVLLKLDKIRFPLLASKK